MLHQRDTELKQYSVSETVVGVADPRWNRVVHRSSGITFDGNALRIHVDAWYKRIAPVYFFPEARLWYGIAQRCHCCRWEGRRIISLQPSSRVGVAFADEVTC